VESGIRREWMKRIWDRENLGKKGRRDFGDLTCCATILGGRILVEVVGEMDWMAFRCENKV